MENQTNLTTEAQPAFVREALMEGVRRLSAAGIESARLDAELLLRQVLRMEKTRFHLNLDAALNATEARQFHQLLRRRAEREPVAYITGQKEFWSLDFVVSRDVLIPRPETELVVEVALACAAKRKDASEPRILDIGTGSGNIAVCLARERPDADIWATDISEAALEVARLNAKRHGVADRIRFLRGDLCEAAGAGAQDFHMIVSNPPYVRRGDLAGLQPEITRWEPLTALDGGVDGLDHYRRIVGQAPCYLVEGGHLIVEIGADMASVVSSLLAGASSYAPPSVSRDCAGNDRVIATTLSKTELKGAGRG